MGVQQSLPRRQGLLTDHYELTMLQAALRDGTAERRCVFEVFARRLPEGRRYGVVAGTGRLVEAIANFSYAADELAELAAPRGGRPADLRLARAATGSPVTSPATPRARSSCPAHPC